MQPESRGPLLAAPVTDHPRRVDYWALLATPLQLSPTGLASHAPLPTRQTMPAFSVCASSPIP
jgi:hypothetical protein